MGVHTPNHGCFDTCDSIITACHSIINHAIRHGLPPGRKSAYGLLWVVRRELLSGYGLIPTQKRNTRLEFIKSGIFSGVDNGIE
jgi:hypothetical protein